MVKKSDYTDPRTNLYELLPEVFQSQTNESVFENTFNRFLSKPQLTLVDGFAGEPFTNAVLNRQIVEPTPHRQAFQLQPLLFAKLGTINHLSSYVDILNEIERLGIDDCRLPLWGNTLQFNWVPPINIDKLINFRNYYWFNVDDGTDLPQYITIESPCNKATEREDAFSTTVDTFGDLQPILGLNTTNKTITIGKPTAGSPGNGDLTDVFTAGFVFFVQDSTNTSIESSFFTTVSSIFDIDTDLTTITVSEAITDDSTIDGNISFDVTLRILQSAMTCACGDDVGWDFAPWDDNQTGAVLWASGLLTAITHATEAEWTAAVLDSDDVGSPIVLPGSPAIPVDLSIWYDTTTNTLKQFFNSVWNIVQSNFSAIVIQQTGTHFWDFTSTCESVSNPWTDENKWFHKNHISNFSIAKQADIPIIEYDFTTQLNRWTFTDYVWKYRSSSSETFAVLGSPSSRRPILNELVPFSYVIASGSPLTTITISPEFGDLTDTLIAGYQFSIRSDALDVANNGAYTVVSSSYTTTSTTPGDELATVVVTEETFSSANQSETSISTSPTVTGSGGEIIPKLTTIGDFFLEYNEHWAFGDQLDGTEPATGRTLPVPSPPPTPNPFTDLDFLSFPTSVPGVGEYLTSTPVDLSAGYGKEPYIFTIEYTVLPTLAPGGVTSGTVIPLDPGQILRAPIGESAVRVVYNEQQQYGTFTELDTGVPFGSPAFGSPFLAAGPGSPLTGSPREGLSDGFVDSITLSFDLDEFDILRITVGEQAVEDMGRGVVSVRTIDDDTAFTAASVGSPITQPETVSLIQYRKIDPFKTQTNEYPLFDIFDCKGTALNLANPIFKWREDPDADVNIKIGLRITGTSTEDFEFENLLIDTDTLPRPVLYTYISTSTNLTLWRKGLNDEEYVPSYVNSEGVIGSPAVAVDSPLGSWEIPNQLYFNAEHENRQFVTFPDVITHFQTILDEQTDFPGVVLPGSQSYLLEDLNFGLGGRIKEHNDSYDTFLSSVFVNNVTPLGIIDFAHDQYENSLNTIKELYRRNLLTFLTDTSTDSIDDFQGTINTSVITSYELNDFLAFVYGDTNAFVAGSPELGVKNWPATLPFVGLGTKKQPHVITDDDLSLLQLIHHDGHRSNNSLTTSTKESTTQTLINTSDSRVAGETFGVQQAVGPPDVYSDLVAQITPRPGVYWFAVVAGVSTLWRFAVIAVDSIEPNSAPVGSLWYDTSTDLLKQLQSDFVTWSNVEAGSPQVEIITEAWEEIDYDVILTDLLLEIEQRLFEAVPAVGSPELDFNVNDTLTSEISCPTASTTITEADTGAVLFEEAFNNFLTDTDVDDAFSADQFFVLADPFTWNYGLSIITTRPMFGSPGTASGGWWTDVYQNLYGTPYPHLEPWAFQGYTSKPTWWDTEYKVDPDNATDVAIYGTRRWKYIHVCAGSPCIVASGSPLLGSPYEHSSPQLAGLQGSPLDVTRKGMWEEIRAGRVPVGQLLPGGSTSTGANGEAQPWNYFSVNIADITINTFAPDAVFPPFWDHDTNGGGDMVRSVFSDFSGEIILPSADYTFDSGGPTCFDWDVSSQRLYDDLTVGYKMQPVRFIHSTFGVDFFEVNGLQLNTSDCKVYSHRDVLFHGDIIDTNQVLSVEGINQWYVNFNRFSGFDVASSDFRPLWQGWEPLLAYQLASVIDTQSLTIENGAFDITGRDFQFILKRSPAIDSFDLDAFNIKVLESPNKLARFDTESLWKFQIDTFFPITRSLSYHEVHNYPVGVDNLTDTFNLYQYNIIDVDISGTFFLGGDQTDAFTTSNTFTVADSTGNDGTYTATDVTFNTILNQTAITVGGSPPTLDITVDGTLTTDYRTHPWSTGDKIELTAVENVPAPLVANREYFVIKIDDVTFQLASTLSDATTGRNIILSSIGAGQIHAGQVFSKFIALNGISSSNRVWNHYAIDTRFTRSIIPPQRETGIQNLINIIDGYAIIVANDGWTINLDNLEQDPDSGQPITWALETERFIDQIFRLPAQRAVLPDLYPVLVDPVADTLTMINVTPTTWQTGTRVSVSGTLPSPLLTNVTYYVIQAGSPASNSIIQLALTSSDAILGVPINIIPGGSASITVFETPTPESRNPSIEVNPFRNNIWLNTPQGILSNVVDGPTDDIRNSQLITDQSGNQLTGEDITVFRWDKVARILIPAPISNPVVPVGGITPYNTIHMASMQAFVDGYESILLFNDDAEDGTLIYDPFVGLNTARFNLRFFRQDEFTQRPVVGGYFITPDDEILRNIEASVLDIQLLYDTNTVLETIPIIIEGRKTLGYRSSEQAFLDEIGLNPKSKFLFWKGMIQNKGSVKAVDAFTNSIKFVDSVVDEFWAYKVADFGTAYEQEYPALKLVIDDSKQSEKRFEFLAPGTAVSSAADTFEGILLTNQDRWFDQPDALEVLTDNNLSFYFEAEVTSVQTITSGTLNGSPNPSWYVETTVPFDDVIILRIDTNTNTIVLNGSPGDPAVPELLAELDYEIINSKLIRFTADPAISLAGSPNIGSPSSEEYRLYTFNPAKDKANPAKVIDIKADPNIVINDVPIWDPRRDHQYHIAENVVELQTNVDPASYTDGLDPSKINTEFWNEPEVGKVWWDTNERGYVPYHDSNIFELDDRVQNWGRLADWSDVKLYQWTKSDILPSEWDAVAAEEELDISIDPLIRKTGQAKLEAFQRTRVALTIVDVYPSETDSELPITRPANVIVVNDSDGILSLNDRIVFTTTDELPLPLLTGTFYFIVSITPAGSPTGSATEITVSLEESGTVFEIKPGAVVVDIVNTDAGIGTNPTRLTNDFDTSGIQNVTFSAAKTGTSVTGLRGSPEGTHFYQSGFSVNSGGLQTVTFLGEEAQTYTELLDLLNANITGATTALLSGTLTITSNTTGTSSTIDITDGVGGSPIPIGSPNVLGIFVSLNDFSSVATEVDGVNATTYTVELDFENGPRLITVIGNEAQNWTQLLSVINAQLATGSISTVGSPSAGSPGITNLLIDAGNNTVTITNDGLFDQFGSPAGNFFNEFIPQNTGDGTQSVIPPFSDDDWIQLENVKTADLITARDANSSDQFNLIVAGNGIGSPDPTGINAGDTVDVYVNGTLFTGFVGSPNNETTVAVGGLTTIPGTNRQDFIVARKTKHVLTTEESDFDPDVFDDGSNLTQFKEDYNFSTTVAVDDTDNQVTEYFFWVENKTTRERENVAMTTAVTELETIPTPYMIQDNLLGEFFGSPTAGSPSFVAAPRRYTQLLLRGLAGIVDDTDRYILRFTRDFSLRDNLFTRNYTTDLTADFLRVGAEPLDLKSHHTEWSLIRENQPTSIPRALWDSATEAMAAHKLGDTATRVPSLAREVYDLQFETDTQYGLGDDQAFVDGALALATLLDDLTDPNNDFSPVDINTFFASHDFTTSAGIVTGMDDIYNQFPFSAVNRIWFKILLDAFTTKQQYAELFKTSWVSLSGTQIFQTEELFTG